jgi:RNA polymerase sigma-70 factor (ECF subfamily)
MTTTDYNQCVHDYADRLYRFAFSMVSHEMDAEDVVQTVFERLWKRHDDVEAGAVKSYLFTSVHRACIDHFRRKKTGMRALDQIRISEAVPADTSLETKQLIDMALKRLPEKQRSMVLMRDYEGYSYKEIAEMMELTESQVKINLFRARKKLQIFLTKTYCKTG